MEVKTTKSKISLLTLLASLFVLVLGILLLILPDELVEGLLVVTVIGVLVVYGVARMVYCFRMNKRAVGVLTMVVTWAAAAILLTVDYSLDSVAVLPSIIVGTVSLILGLLRLLICISCFRNKMNGAVRNGISAFFCILFGLFLIIRPIEHFGLLSTVAGFYLIFYAVTMFGDFIFSIFHIDLRAGRVSRRTRFALPNLISATSPARMITAINKEREAGRIKGGMIIERKPDVEFETVNVEIMVHLTTQGTNRFGHVDIAVGDKIYSYGTYDSSKDQYGGFVSQGTFIIVPKIPYLKFCLDYQKKYVIGFGAHLSDKQLEGVENKINELLGYCEPFESLYEAAVKNGEDGSQLHDPASNIVRDVGGKVYTVKEGPFKRYFGINSNCVKVADWLLSDSGIDRISFSGISTPGAYYSMLNSMFRRKNTRIIRKTTYIIADDIDDLEELRRLARETAAEMADRTADKPD